MARPGAYGDTSTIAGPTCRDLDALIRLMARDDGVIDSVIGGSGLDWSVVNRDGNCDVKK